MVWFLFIRSSLSLKICFFNDPRISRMVEKMLRFCPKFFVLYASIYGTSKMTYIIIYLIFGSKYVHLNPHCGKEMIRNNSSSLRSQIEFVFFFSFSDLTSRRCWNKGKLLRQSKCFHAQIKYKVKYKSLAIAIKRFFLHWKQCGNLNQLYCSYWSPSKESLF